MVTNDGTQLVLLHDYEPEDTLDKSFCLQCLDLFVCKARHFGNPDCLDYFVPLYPRAWTRDIPDVEYWQ